ncbi:MAG TPA: hypothetical protein VMJ32_11830 [Pirellulales bacterium]|nr:hypothetical protein [Pirellulales bacterium]
MNRLFLLFALLAAPALLLADDNAPCPGEHCQTDDGCDCKCAHCGCQAHCQKICHVVCEWKDVKETVYACRCSDVCIPGPSEKCCTKIDECDPNNCSLLHDYKPLYSIWNPSECARIRSVTKLVKIEVTHKVPTYKWVVEYCCDKCRCEIAENQTPNERLAASEQSSPQSHPADQATNVKTASVQSSSHCSPAEILDPQITLPDLHSTAPRWLPGFSAASSQAE